MPLPCSDNSVSISKARGERPYPDLLCEYAKTAKSRGIGVIIAGAGGAAHLPGMVASMTTLPWWASP